MSFPLPLRDQISRSRVLEEELLLDRLFDIHCILLYPRSRERRE